MRIEVLLGGLRNPQPVVRLDVVRVLGMLDEVRALPALREHYNQEPVAEVRSAVAWAGKRLYAAQQANYSTLEEVFQYFGVQREIENMPDAAEAALMQKMEDDLQSTLQDRTIRARTRQAGLSVAAGLGVGMVAGGMMGLSAMNAGMSAGAGAASSNLGQSRPEFGLKRTPPMAPTTMDIAVWARRLRESSNPEQREQAALELSQLNNPAALPHLAAAFISDTAPQVRQAAQRFGKVLYWNSVYWEMEQDGSLKAEIARRMAAMGKQTEKPVTPPGSGPLNADAAGPAAQAGGTGGLSGGPSQGQSQADVAEILRKAQEARAQRKRKTRS